MLSCPLVIYSFASHCLVMACYLLQMVGSVLQERLLFIYFLPQLIVESLEWRFRGAVGFSVVTVSQLPGVRYMGR